MKFKIGDKVNCNGNPDSRIVDAWTDGELTMYVIRLWDGFRHVGDTQMGELSLLAQQVDPIVLE